MSRVALLVVHTGREGNIAHAQRVAHGLAQAGFVIRVLAEETARLGFPAAVTVPPDEAAHGAEIVIALGGDGTLLRAADLAYPAGTPLLGVNLGRVGFLAEAEAEHLDTVIDRIAERRYDVDERLAIEAIVFDDGAEVGRGWALNEVAVEKGPPQRMVEVLASIDGEPVAQWGCDGVLCATPTGSTAYAFSAGGPVIWPDVEALLVVPISAHALFNRPLVVAPSSVVTFDVARGTAASVTFDGQRSFDIARRGRVEVRRHARSIRVVRLRQRTFTGRLVAKFGLDVNGWR